MRHHRDRSLSFSPCFAIPSTILRRSVDVPLLRSTRVFDPSSARAAEKREEGGDREKEVGPWVRKGVMFAVVAVKVEGSEANEKNEGDGDRESDLQGGPGDR